MPTFNLKSNKLPRNSQINTSMESRWEYTEHSFPILTEDWILEFNTLTKGKTVVELCAGSGWLSHWLKKYGVNVTATTDDMSWHKSGRLKNILPLVENMDALTAISTYPADIYILSWPYMDDTALKIWEALPAGSTLLYIGEGPHGCTADEAFFESVDIYADSSIWIRNFMRFQGLHDYATLIPKTDN